MPLWVNTILYIDTRILVNTRTRDSRGSAQPRNQSLTQFSSQATFNFQSKNFSYDHAEWSYSHWKRSGKKITVQKQVRLVSLIELSRRMGPVSLSCASSDPKLRLSNTSVPTQIITLLQDFFSFSSSYNGNILFAFMSIRRERWLLPW